MAGAAAQMAVSTVLKGTQELRFDRFRLGAVALHHKPQLCYVACSTTCCTMCAVEIWQQHLRD
jgi:hypothetical protein